jgi:hypothetical protein
MTLTAYEDLVVGKTYILHHQRKGNCTFRVDEWYSIDDDMDAFVSGMVVSGHLRGIGVGSYRGPGDIATVRWSLCTFTKPIEKGTVK